MKAKKAVKRLSRVEALLSDVIDQYPAGDGVLRELLDNAKASVVRARETVNGKPSPGTAKKAPPATVPNATKSRLSPEGRKKLSLAAKKRWAAAKRKGVSAVTGRPLSKTA